MALTSRSISTFFFQESCSKRQALHCPGSAPAPCCHIPEYPRLHETVPREGTIYPRLLEGDLSCLKLPLPHELYESVGQGTVRVCLQELHLKYLMSIGTGQCMLCSTISDVWSPQSSRCGVTATGVEGATFILDVDVQ